LTIRQIGVGVGVGSQHDQGPQAVANNFGGNILGPSLLSQNGNVLQIEPVLAPLECLVSYESHVSVSSATTVASLYHS
jgi:hypothetical protein